MYYLGFDPGGEGNFGWSVCRADGNEPLILVAAGNADHSKGAFDAALAAIPFGEIPVAAGIDAPLFWIVDGGRVVDDIVRKAIKRAGAPAPGGTVQHFNSLRGSCVIQGMLLAQLLRAKYSELPITEAHPKALLWILGMANKETAAADIPLHAVCELPPSSGLQNFAEHERDAVLSAYTARAMLLCDKTWTDLARLEKNRIVAVDGPLGYWMPSASLHN